MLYVYLNYKRGQSKLNFFYCVTADDEYWWCNTTIFHSREIMWYYSMPSSRLSASPQLNRQSRLGEKKGLFGFL